MSPMKWMLINLLTQSSMIQMISFLSMTKIYNSNMSKVNIFIHKLSWKW